MGVKERCTIKKLSDKQKAKIDLDYYNTVYQYQFENMEQVPDAFKSAHNHFNRSNRLIYLCHHLHEFRKLSLRQIAIKYGVNHHAVQDYIGAYREMKESGVCC